MSASAVTVARIHPPWHRILHIGFWLWFGVSAAISIRTIDAVWPYTLGLVWAIVWFFQEPLQRAALRLHLPRIAKFLLIGLFFMDAIMENLATSFKGDLDPNLLKNDFLWIGSYVCVLLVWWTFAHFYRFTALTVFFVYGFKGVLIEQDFLIAKLLYKGDYYAALVGIPLIAVVYGAAVAPVFLVMGEQLNWSSRKPGVIACVLVVGCAVGAFYGGAYIWFKFCVLLGMKLPGM